MVMGPTPPGTGVIAPATSRAASKSTSPTRPSPVRFTPTSITVAPGLHPVRLHQTGRADRGDQDVGASADASQVPGPRVADGDRSVRVQEQAGERPADQDRASDDHRIGPLRLDPRMPEELHNALRRARHEARTALGEQSGARGGEPIDVLRRVDRGKHRVLVDLAGEWYLDQDPVHLVFGVQLVDQSEQAVLGDRGLQPVVDRAHPSLLGLLALVGDVDVRGGVIAHEHGGEARDAAARCRELPHRCRYSSADLRRDGLAVYHRPGHAWLQIRDLRPQTFFSGA